MRHLPLVAILTVGPALLSTTPLEAQERPDFSGVWRLDPTESSLGPLGEREILEVFQRLGPLPSQDSAAPEPLPSIDLPPDLDRVLRDYERNWQAGNADSLAALFTEDGFVRSRGRWIRGRDAIRAAYGNTSSPLRLRALEYAVENGVGYIIGAYGYGAEVPVPDQGSFILILRRSESGRWLIAADLDAGRSP